VANIVFKNKMGYPVLPWGFHSCYANEAMLERNTVANIMFNTQMGFPVIPWGFNSCYAKEAMLERNTVAHIKFITLGYGPHGRVGSDMWDLGVLIAVSNN
jgi:hypothetical protein